MAKCGVCGVDVTFDMMQYYVPDFDGKKHRVCKNCSLLAADKALKYDPASGRVIFVEKSEIEIRKKCNVCGHVFCYNPVDLDNNKKKQSQALWSAVGSLGGAMSGHYTASAVHQSNTNQAMSGIVDYSKCPNCGSMDLRTISKEELAAERAPSQQTSTAPVASVADELLKYKELLDLGVLTQEEFNTKKQELLAGTSAPVQPAPAPITQSAPPAPAGPSIATLRLVRPNQFFVINPAIKVTVDDVPQMDLRNDSHVAVVLPAGKHTVCVKQSLRSTTFDIDLQADTSINVSWNRITGCIDVKPDGIVDMYISKKR